MNNRVTVRFNPDDDRWELRDSLNQVVTSYRNEETARRTADRHNNRVEDNDMSNENEREKRVSPVALAGFSTNTVKMKAGWVGQINAGSNDCVVWDSEPFEEKNDAQTSANDKLKEKLGSLFD